jgi:hypothetical protein
MEEALSSTLLVHNYQTETITSQKAVFLTHTTVRAPDLISELVLIFCVRDGHLEKVFLYCEEQKAVTPFFGRSLNVVFCA